MTCLLNVFAILNASAIGSVVHDVAAVVGDSPSFAATGTLLFVARQRETTFSVPERLK